jgi:coenzyme F420-dependent glucose-6-phosphate dehydrogenase
VRLGTTLLYRQVEAFCLPPPASGIEAPVEYGYALSSEEHSPQDLVRNARRAEGAGFSFALVSDHFHPWLDAQGHSPFVWSVIGGIAEATERIRLGTGVACPLIRMHPALLAQAAATCASMMPGRFFLCVGTGENLNEHVLGDRWPAPDERLELLEEAIALIRELWRGETTTHRGRRYTVDRARIYTLPEELPQIAVAASAPQAAELAGRLGDMIVSTAPDESLIGRFEEGGGRGKPKLGMVHVCWAETAERAAATAFEIWPNSALTGSLNTELATPEDFEGACEVLSKEDVAGTVTHGPDVAPYLDEVRSFARAGYDHVYFHQVGRDQEGFFSFWERELRPALEREP